MDSVLETYKNTGDIAHGYFFVGNISSLVKSVLSFAEKDMGVCISGNPDVVVVEKNVFTIDDARKIRETGRHTAVSGGKRLFLIGAGSFTEDSQNALLKMIEEPIPGHHFFLFAPNEISISPVLRSRMVVIKEGALGVCSDGGVCKEFIRADAQDRLLLIKKIIDEFENNEDTRGARMWGSGFLRCLEMKLAAGLSDKKVYERKRHDAALGEIIKCEGYMLDLASSPKLILEHLCFIVPRGE